MAPPQKPVLNISYSGGNSWSPPVTAYIPTKEADIQGMRSLPWHTREFSFSPASETYRTFKYQADGVLRELRLDFNFKVEAQHEIGISSRAYYLTAGSVPSALLISDQFIEWFHSDIYADPDPFARRIYGFNQAGIRLQDQNGRELVLEEGAFFIPGTELRYVYYPHLFQSETFALKAAAHAGFNHHRYNTSVDGGVSVTGIKLFRVGSNRSFQVGFSPGLVRRNLVAAANSVDLIESKTGFNFQGLYRYNWSGRNSTKNSLSSISLGFNNQSAYYTGNKCEDFWVLTGQRYTSHWAVTVHHLFRKLQSWTLAYQYSRKYVFTCYLQEDMLVNNGPDLQLGVSLGIPLATVNANQAATKK